MSSNDDGPGSYGKAAARDAAIAVGVTAAAALGAPGVLAAAAGGVLGLGFDRITAQDTRRAQRLVERLLERDESPEQFADHIRERLLAEDEGVLSAFRSLLTAALDAVSPAALEPMAVLARRHLREPRIPMWLARGGLRTLAECTAEELGGLRQFVTALPALASTGINRVGVFVHDQQLEIIGHRGAARIGTRLLGPAPAHSRRVFRVLKVHGLADDATDAPSDISTPDAIAIETLVVSELILALSS